MATFQFACPYCSGPFEVEHAAAGQTVACPHCGGAVALPTALPAPRVELSEPSPESPTQSRARGDSAAAKEPDSPFDFIEQPGSSLHRSVGSQRPPAPMPTLRRLTPEEKERRRFRRNLVLMAVGMLVLAVAAAVLIRV